jgi:hypothetical protein
MASSSQGRAPSKVVELSIYPPRDNSNACLSFPKLLTRPTRSSDFVKTIPLEAYSIISHVEYKISILTCDIDYTISQSVRRSSTMGSIPDG